MREVILDTETTGLNVKDGDRIIEVGCVELINHIPTGKNLQFYCFTEKKIDAAAVKVHGLTNDFLSDQPTFKKNANKFLEFIKNDDLIIHNADFDTNFVNNELKLIGISPINNKIIDTVTLARKVLNTRIANLDYLCKRFAIDLSARSLHGAILDCQLLAEVYLELLGGKQIPLELSRLKNNPTNETKQKTTEKINIITINITNEEIKSHKEHTKNIKNALWHKLDY